MSALTMNGWAVAAKNGSVTREVVFKGQRDRAVSAKHRDSRRDKKRAWDVVTCFSDIEAADALEAFAQGLGHVWSYKNGVAASTGAKPDADSDILFVPTGGRFDGYLSVLSGLLVNHTLPIEDDWTAFGWVDDDTGAGWQHWVVRSDGAQFLDGVKGSFGLSNTLLVIESVQLMNLNGNDRTGAASDVKVDELVFLPWFATDEMIEAWANYTLPFSPLPFIDISGDFIEDPLFVRVRGGKLTGSFVEAGGRKLRAGSAFRSNDVAVGVRLFEKKTGDARSLLPLPLSYWPLDKELVGASVLDLMGNNDGSVIGGLAPVPGVVDEAQEVDDTSSYISIPHSAGLAITGDLTICGWWRLDALGLFGRTLITKVLDGGGAGASPYALVVNSAGALTFTHRFSAVSFENFTTSAGIIATDEMNHIAVTRGDSKIGIYLNGRLVDDAFLAQALTPADNGDGVLIGRNKSLFGASLSNFLGVEDDIAIYNQRASSDQVNLIYNLGLRGRRQRSV